MAIKKHAMTKEGAIVTITRHQIKQIEENKNVKGIEANFVKFYMEYEDEKIQKIYKENFGIELVIVKDR